MADLANIGFRADTASLASAEKQLDKLAPAAGRAETASEKLGLSLDQTGAAARRMSSALDTAAAGVASEGNALNAASAAVDRKASAISRLIGWLTRVKPAADSAAMGVNNVNKAANDNAAVMRGNVGNIAAQFQDIGVTAAAGMNPLIIALQQGTQLSAVFAQSGQSMGATLAAAFGSIISPVALLTIGLVALAAAGLQMVDWAALGKSALNGLADVLETIAPYAIAATGALVLIYSPSIIAGIASVTKGLFSMAAGLLAVVPVPVLIVAGLTAIVAAANYFRNDLTKILGFDIVAAAKNGVNFIIGGFVGGFNAIKKTWSMLPAAIGDSVIQAANFVIRTVDGMVNKAVEKLNGMISGLPAWLGGNARISMRANSGQLANPFAGAAAKVGGVAAQEVGAAQGKDWVGGFVKGAQSWAKWGADQLRGLAGSIGAGDGTKGKKGPKAAASPKAKSPYAGDTMNPVDMRYDVTDEFRTPSLDIAGLAKSSALVDDWFDKYMEGVERAKELTKSFVSDLRQGLKSGADFFTTFGNAVMNVVDKVIDRLLNAAIDGLFAPGGGGGGGFLGKLLGNLGGSGGGGGGGGLSGFCPDFTPTASPLVLTAKGAAFGSQGIVKSPTLYGIAGGGMGMMGESGAEAVMPLVRGPDGSLGVQSNGGGGTPSINVNINNDNRVSGAVSSADIVELQRRSAEQAKADMKREIPYVLEQYRRDGAIV